MHDQIIYYGAPGTGKSYAVAQYLEKNNIPKERIFRVTIYPEFTYSDFIGQLLPEEDSVTKKLRFNFEPGQFTKALKKAFEDNSKEVFLILEEISRGNITSIFGDVFQLLDRNDQFESAFPIKNKEIASQIPQLPNNETVFLPSNFNIICTMNTNDQSVYPMDTAFKRRFDWHYVSTLPAKNANGTVDDNLNNPLLIIRSKKNGGTSDFKMSWLAFYTGLNAFITNKTLGLGMKEDKQLGQFFLKFKSSLVFASRSNDPKIANPAFQIIDEIIQNKLLVYLWQDIQPESSFVTGKTLFSNSISDFETLFSSYCNSEQIFSDEFIDGFLKPRENLYK